MRIFCGIFIAVLIGLVSFSVIAIAESGTEVPLSTIQPAGLSPEVQDYLSPPSTEAPAPFILTDISDEDFATAEVAVAIDYNLVGCNLTERSPQAMRAKGQELMAGLEITVGVETVVLGSGPITGLNLQSLTCLQTIASRRSARFWDSSLTARRTTEQLKPIELGNRTINRGAMNSTVTTIASRIQALGFTKEDLLIRPNERHWFIRIVDQNPEPPDIPGEEYERPVACLTSFNITVGDIRYRSLVHPVFAAGWDVTSEITGRSGELFQRVARSSPRSDTPGLLSYFYNVFTPLGLVYGVAGIITVAYFDHLDDLGTSAVEDGNYIFTWLMNQGYQWEIYFMMTKYSYQKIDDSDIIWLLDSCVDDQMTRNNDDYGTVHTLWYIATHGRATSSRREIASTNTEVYPITGNWNNYVSEGELGTQMNKITGDGYYLFFWMSFCHGTGFTDLWEHESYHHNKALLWYYCHHITGQSNQNREMWCWAYHFYYGSYSAQDMFNPGDSGHNYGPPVNKFIYWVKVAFDTVVGDGHHMYQQNKMGSHDFYF